MVAIEHIYNGYLYALPPMIGYSVDCVVMVVLEVLIRLGERDEERDTSEIFSSFGY